MWYINELNYLGVTVTVRVYTSVRPGRARRALPCYIFSEIRIFWRGLGRSPNKSSMVYGMYELNYLRVTVGGYTLVRPASGRARRALPCYNFSKIRIFWQARARLSSLRVGQALVVLG